MTIINNQLYLNSPEDNIYPGELVDSSLSTGQNIDILQPSATLGGMAMTSNEITILAQGSIAEMEESPGAQPSTIEANTSELALNDIFGPINQDDILGLPVQTEKNASKEKGTPSRDLSSVYSLRMSSILPEAANRSESGALSSYLLNQGIVPAHLRSSRSIKLHVSVIFLVSLYNNTKKENKNKISEHIIKIGEGLLGVGAASVYISCVELLEILNLPENNMFIIYHAKLTSRCIQKIKEKLFVPPVLDANNEHFESSYATINTLFKAAKKESLKPTTATYFETYLDLVKDSKYAKCRLSFEKNALVELLNCQNASSAMSKQEQTAYYTLRKKILPEQEKKRKRVQKEAQSISALSNQQGQPIAKMAKTPAEQAELPLNPFEQKAEGYIPFTPASSNEEFPFPFQD